MTNPADKQSAMRDKLVVLADRFLQRCANDMSSGRELMGRIKSGDASAYKDLEHLAHRMVGTGASLGFQSLSAKAVNIERCAEAQVAEGAVDPEAIARLDEHLTQLESEIELLVRARG